MVDDDDPKTPAPAPQGVPAGEQEPETPTDEEPEGEEPEGEAETKAPAEEAGGVDESDDDEDDDGDDEKSAKSRAARYRRTAEKLKAERDAALRARDSGGLPPISDANSFRAFVDNAVVNEIGPPPDRSDPKYKDDYPRFDREASAWETDRRAVEREIKRDLQQRVTRERDRYAGLIADHKERVAKLRTRVPDLDQTMARATAPVAQHVERLILESPRSERVMLHLAIDQAKLVKLNNSSPEEVAREIGRIEGRLSLPQTKTQTKARAPMKPLRGSGTSPPSGLAAVNAYIKQRYPDRK